jgi:hypothetical protein
MTAMRDRVTIGQRWQRRRDGKVVEIRQVHRADREVEVRFVEDKVGAATRIRRCLSFTELRTRWRLVDG